MNKVNGVLPAGTDLNAATAGFKNFGGFMSAVNVSNNLGIQFADLKAALTGTTLSGAPTTSGATAGAATASSLGQAIQQLKPGVDATAEAQRAQAQATLETGEASTTNTTSATSTSSPVSTTSTSGSTSKSSGKGKSK